MARRIRRRQRPRKESDPKRRTCCSNRRGVNQSQEQSRPLDWSHNWRNWRSENTLHCFYESPVLPQVLFTPYWTLTVRSACTATRQMTFNTHSTCVRDVWRAPSLGKRAWRSISSHNPTILHPFSAEAHLILKRSSSVHRADLQIFKFIIWNNILEHNLDFSSPS